MSKNGERNKLMGLGPQPILSTREAGTQRSCALGIKSGNRLFM